MNVHAHTQGKLQVTSHICTCGTRLIYNQMECNDVKGRGWSELTQGLNMSFMCQSVTSEFSGVEWGNKLLLINEIIRIQSDAILE